MRPEDPGPLVSCIVPVHNGERFLKEAVDSIFAQTHRPIEVIVVDDGSTDGTPEVALSYGARVKCVRQDNAGPAAARNRGVEEARGEFIAFLDSDDTWMPTKIAGQVERFASDPGLGICLCHIRNVWEPEVAEEERRLQGHRRTQPVPGYSTVALMARASVFGVVGPFDTRLGHTDDTDWFVRARAAGVKATVLPDVLVHRRMHLGNRSRRRAAASREEYLRLAKAALDRKRTPRQRGSP